MLAMACIEPEPLPPLPQFKTTNRVEPYHEPYPVHEHKHKGAQHLF